MPDTPERYADRDVPYVFILPSLSADIRLALSGNAEPYSSVLSAARFLRLVRGLPLDEIEVECDGKIYTVTVEADGKCYISIPKFTALAEDTVTLFGCDIKVRSVKTPYGIVRVTKALSVADFSDSVLRALTLSKNGENIIGAVCYELSENGAVAVCHFSKEKSIPKSLVAANSAVSCIYGSYSQPFRVEISGEEIFFIFRGWRLLVSDGQPRPLTLYAPDIT